MNARRSAHIRLVVPSLVLVVIGTVIYFVLPVPGRMHETNWAILFGLGLVALGCLIVYTIVRLLRSSEAAKVRGIVLALCLAVLFFSYADDSLAAIPGQFVSLHTKTDALYFNISTLATVGFGDVHASGQLARAAVTLQIIFNLVFLGAAVGIISGLVRVRAQQRYAGRGGQSGTGG
jgi:voltage-gated potassium channel